MKRTSGAKAEQMSLDMGSERNFEEIGSGSKSEKGRGSGRRSVKKVYRRGPGVPTTISGACDIKVLFRGFRQQTVNRFNSDYVYGALKSKAKDQGSSSRHDCRTLIWSGGCGSCLVASSGITWVAVHGKEIICVVTKKNQHLDNARLRGSLLELEKEDILKGFMTTIAHEMEDPSSELRRRLMKQDVEIRSFAAVSMALSIDGPHKGIGREGSIAWPGKDVAINSLKERMKINPDLARDETIQTAISAFEDLHQEKFNAEDILVDILMKGEEVDRQLPPEEMKQHLAVVHDEPWVGYCCSKKLKHSADQ